jgi:hypothetical protein
MPATALWVVRLELFTPTGPVDGSYDNGKDLVGFSQQGLNVLPIGDAGFHQELKPVCRLIGFFFNDAELRAKLGGAPGAARRPVVSAYGGA